MNPPSAAPTDPAPLAAPPVEPCSLDSLLAAIASAIDALVTWDISAFDSAVERQRIICARLSCATGSRAPGASSAALPDPACATGSAALPDPAPVAGSAVIPDTPTATTARKIRDLNRVYDRLLQHSIQWTRTMHSILEAGGHSCSGRASVHFKG